MNTLIRLLWFGLWVKIATYTLICLLGFLFYPLDASLQLIPLRFPILRPFSNWDGVHFISLACKGYSFEHNCAFFPLLPWILASNSPDLAIIKGLLINLVANLVSIWMLWHVSMEKVPELAIGSVIFFILNPSIAFHSAIYTESLYTALFLSGYYWLLCERSKRRFVGIICWLAAGFLRSNGMLSGVLLVLEDAFFKANAREKAFRLILAAFCVVPFLLVQCYFQWLFQFPHFTSYSHIQSKYWNVGFLTYYTLNNLPNFLISIPSFLTFVNGMHFLSKNWRMNSGWIFLWSFLVLHCALFCNVQIVTRLLSPLPPVYWTLSALWHQKSYKLPLTMVGYGIIGIALFACFYPPA